MFMEIDEIRVHLKLPSTGALLIDYTKAENGAVLFKTILT